MASVGVGSACFHCTLRHVEQQCDETPMVLTLLNWFYELFADTWEGNSFLKAAMPVLLVVYGVVRQRVWDKIFVREKKNNEVLRAFCDVVASNL